MARAFRALVGVVALLATLWLAAVAGAATLTEYSTSSAVEQILTGPDGNLWFTESNQRVGTMATSDASVTEFSSGITSGAELRGIAVHGSDVWFTEPNEDKVGKINTSTHAITEYSNGISSGAHPDHIALGSDGDLWFTEPGLDQVAKIDPSTGTVTQYGSIAGISAGSAPTGIAAGPNGTMWFTETAGNRIGRIDTTTGAVSEYSSGLSSGAHPLGIVAGPGGALWFTESHQVSGYMQIGRINPGDGSIKEFQRNYTSSVSAPLEIALAPGGNDLLFSAAYNGQQGEVDRMSTLGANGSFQAPGTTSVPDGVTAGPDGNIWIAENGNVGKLTLGTAPVASTTAASGATASQATLNGTVNPEGTDTGYLFEYGATNSYGSVTPTFSGFSGTSAVAHSRTVSSLSAGSTYHFQIVATSIDGDSAGGDQQFTTAAGAVAPTVSTGAADSVAQTTANLNATVNPNSGATTYHFEWGTDTTYGHVTPDGSLPADATVHYVSASLSGLPSGTVIHYRIVASNSASPSPVLGSDRVLTTYTSTAPGAGGSPDSAFGSGGEAGFSFGSTSFSAFLAIARQKDGELVLAGFSDQPSGQQWALARMNTDGTPDTSFGAGGTGTLLLAVPGSTASATAVAVQPDGKILVAGSGTSGEVMRLNADGSADGSWNGGAAVSLGSLMPAGLAVQPADGKVVIAGTSNGAMAVARLNGDGTGDSSFGSGGVVTPAFGGGGGSAGAALAIQGDGGIVVAGSAGSDFAAARLKPDGTPDSGFGSGGVVTAAVPGGAPGGAAALTLQADGKLVLAGSDSSGAADAVRLASDGSLDSGFGTGGWSSFTIPGGGAVTVAGAALDYGGFILLDGHVGLNGEQHGFIARLTPAGALDSAFGQAGLDTFADSAGLAGIAPPVAPPGWSAAPPAPDPPSTGDAAFAGQQVTARDPSGGTPTKTDGSTEVVYDGGRPASCITQDPAGTVRALPGTTTPVTFTVSNCGDTTLTIKAGGVDVRRASPAGSWALASESCSGQTLQPGGSCTFVMNFTPQEVDGNLGGEFALVDVNDSDGASEVADPFGVGVTAAMSCLSPDPVHFGKVDLEYGAKQTVTLSNCGTADLKVTLPPPGKPDGDFFILNSFQNLSCTSTIPPGGSCKFTVGFRPSKVGAESGDIYISDNGIDSPEHLHLDGTGDLVPQCPSIDVTATVDGMKFPTGEPVAGQISASGGTPPYTYTYEPAPGTADELTLGPDGSVHGKPTRDHYWRFEVTATDSHGCTGKTTIVFEAVPRDLLRQPPPVAKGPCPNHPALPRPCADYSVEVTTQGVYDRGLAEHGKASGQAYYLCVSFLVKVSNHGPDATAAQLVLSAPQRVGHNEIIDQQAGYLSGLDHLTREVRAEPGNATLVRLLVCPSELILRNGQGVLDFYNEFFLGAEPVPVTFSAAVRGENDPVAANNGPVIVRTEIPAAFIKDVGVQTGEDIVRGVAGFFSSGTPNGGGHARDGRTGKAPRGKAPRGNAPRTAFRLRVVVAVLRVRSGASAAGARSAHGSCAWLRDRRGHFQVERPSHGVCTPAPVWLAATGERSWHLSLGHLPRGRYVAYARAVDAAGLADAAFDGHLHNRLAFTVH